MTPRKTLRRALILAGLALFSSTAAIAADPAPRVVGVLSLIGDGFQVVVRRMQVGSGLDNNSRQNVAIDDPVFDDTAAAAAERAIKEAMPGAERLRVSIRDKRLYELQDGLLESGPASDGLRAALQSMLQKEKATHLLLVTKRRDEALFRLASERTGSGKVIGVGIFIDPIIELQSAENGSSGTGYFATYAYVKATLIDLSTMKAVASRNGADSRMTTAIGAKDAVNAWEAMPAKGKVDNLVGVIDNAVYGAARELATAR